MAVFKCGICGKQENRDKMIFSDDYTMPLCKRCFDRVTIISRKKKEELEAEKSKIISGLQGCSMKIGKLESENKKMLGDWMKGQNTLKRRNLNLQESIHSLNKSLKHERDKFATIRKQVEEELQRLAIELGNLNDRFYEKNELAVKLKSIYDIHKEKVLDIIGKVTE